MLDRAIELAELGFYVFPLIERGKTPAFKGWQQQASRDPDRIRHWWRARAYNIGISTGRFYDHGQNRERALLVVDVDNKDGRRGDDTLLELELQGQGFPPTWETLTPTGGRHLFYVLDEPVKQGANVFGPGLDVRSRGGYVVGPGSVTEKGEYRWRELPTSHQEFLLS